MGLLEKLWDDTVAGPQPDTGLGRLRKFPPFSIRTDLGKEAASGEDSPVAEAPRVTRSIMIKRPAGSPSGNGTPPDSPAGSTPPVSPFYGSSGGREWNRFRRKSMSDAYDRATGGIATTPRTPTTPASTSSVAAAGFGSNQPYPPYDV